MLFYSKRQCWCPDEMYFWNDSLNVDARCSLLWKCLSVLFRVLLSKIQDLFWALDPNSLMLVFRLRGKPHIALLSHWFWWGLPWKASPTHCFSPLLAEWYAYFTSFWVHNDLPWIDSMHMLPTSFSLRGFVNVNPFSGISFYKYLLKTRRSLLLFNPPPLTGKPICIFLKCIMNEWIMKWDLCDGSTCVSLRLYSSLCQCIFFLFVLSFPCLPCSKCLNAPVERSL